MQNNTIWKIYSKNAISIRILHYQACQTGLADSSFMGIKAPYFAVKSPSQYRLTFTFGQQYYSVLNSTFYPTLSKENGEKAYFFAVIASLTALLFSALTSILE